YQRGRGYGPTQAEAEIMRQRSDADVGPDHDIGQSRPPCGPKAGKTHGDRQASWGVGGRQRRHGLADLSHGTTAGAIALWSNLLRRAVALDNRDVALDRAFHRLLAAARDDAVEERAVDDVERPRLEHRADARHRWGRERNDVGIAAHEAH